MRPGGRLDRIATLLARAGSFPLTLGIGPQTLTTWTRRRRTQPALAPGVARVRNAAARPSNQLLPEPYVPIDGPTIEAEDLGAHLPGEYVAGSNAIEQVTGEIPDPRTAFVDPVDDATVARLTQMLVGRFVVRDTALVPVAEPLTPAQPFILTTSYGHHRARRSRPTAGSSSSSTATGPPALRAQRVLAGAGRDRVRGAVASRVASCSRRRADWSPDVATMTLLLHDLAHDPLVKPATLDTLFSEVAPGRGRRRRPSSVNSHRAPRPRPAPAARQRVRRRGRASSRRTSRWSAARIPSVAAGRNALLLALSTDEHPRRGARAAATPSRRSSTR